jgi:hypothetical protein
MVGGLTMGLAWWMDSSEISANSFFKFLPRRHLLNLDIVSNTEIKMIEERILSSGDTISKQSDNSELFRLRELQKDIILNDMVLCVEQSFMNSKQLKIPHSEDLLSSELVDVAQRMIELRKKLVKRIGNFND